MQALAPAVTTDYAKLLPPEILSSIFLFASAFAKGFLDPYDFPLRLGQICSRWRVVALSTPRLWYRVESLPKLPPDSILSLVSAYVERSRPLPLKLALEVGCNQGLLDLLLGQSVRWGHISISMPESIRAGPSIFATLQNSDFAHLHTLEF
ncbi:hypothetical protein B0H14DRAFT_59807 [Mycena olivaceomarginata]|nr:hypothetical protein B0H14DRAFT_59807 [Mycena olivaceomarginata]